jgi:electron transport complex protein RnfD
MEFDTAPAPHVVAGFSVPRVMYQVLLALIPVATAQVVLYGPGCLLRGRGAAPFVRDGSVLVTAALLALAVSPWLPWWLTLFGTAIAVLLGKHAYGGLGYNPFNPAMVGYAVLLVSFPLEMTRWPLPLGSTTHGWADLAGLSVHALLTGPSADAAWDAYTGATALDALRTGLGQRYTMSEILAQPAFGSLAGAGSQWVNLAALAGGLYLLRRGVIRWQIPAAVLGGIAVPAAVLHSIDAGAHAGPLFHLLSGASMLGAFFIATDPVSAATSDRGRLLYGAGIGAITWLIRTWGGYPDGIAFAVLLMNAAVPLLDRYTVPRIHGHSSR